VTAAAITMAARNPVYSIILLLMVRVVAAFCSSEDATGSELPVARLGAAILLFATLFHGFSIHLGNTVLFRLPVNWPWIGGPITLEAAAVGLTSGLVLFTLIYLFSTFNSVVTISELVRLIPSSLRDLGVVVLIAVTYVPETKRQLQRIREAQAIRGHRLRGVADWRPIVIPLLIGGLERAMGLAEAMVSRGYGATTDARQPLSIQIGLAVGLASALTGWVLTFWISWLGWLVLGFGLILITAFMMRRGRRTPHTEYRSRAWTLGDTLAAMAALVALLLVFPRWPFIDRASMAYSPYPSLVLPGFEPWIGIALLSVAFPAVVTGLKRV
jgi:energy-coupling factor transport system permease protein